MSELPHGMSPAEPPAPLESAAAIVLRAAGSGWQVLLGLRGQDTTFLPGHLAFPGGKLEREDDPASPAAHARCVSRELHEETGVVLPVEGWRDVGERVTPPLFPVRYRTRFFLASVPPTAPEPQPATAENARLLFAAPHLVLEDWSLGRARVPPPVLPILRALAEHPHAELGELAERVAEVNRLEQRAPRIEFQPGVWMLPVRTATLPPATHTNVWMPGRGRFAIVDPGAAEPAEIDRLLEVVARRRQLGGDPAFVLLTHEHRDHTAGALALARVLERPICAHPLTLERLAGAPPASGVELRALEDEEELDLGGTVLRVVATPGHSPGHLAFHLPESRLLIAGDLVSGMSTILVDPEQGSMEDYLGSLEHVRQLGCRVLLPGHGPPLGGSELGRLIEHRTERNERILGALAAGVRALPAIAQTAYADAPGAPAALVERQALSHLILLERRGQARRSDAAGTHWSPANEERA